MTELFESSVPAAAPAAARPRRKAAPAVRVGLVLFAVGLLDVLVIMVLFATGAHDLPLWMNLVAMLAPAGFGIALVGLFLEARSSRRPGSPRQRPGTAGER